MKSKTIKLVWHDTVYDSERSLLYSTIARVRVSMMEQARLCAVWPMENWLGSSWNHIQTG